MRAGATLLLTLVPVMVTEKPQHRTHTRPKKQEMSWSCDLQPVTGELRSAPWRPMMETLQARIRDTSATQTLMGTRKMKTVNMDK